MMKYIIILIGLLSIQSCVSESVKEENSQIEDVAEVEQEIIGEKDAIQSQIIIGSKIWGEVGRYLTKEGDSSEQVISYSFYASPNMDFMDSVNNRIYIFTQGITEFEGQDDRGAVSVPFFENQLDSFATIFNETKELESGLWELDAGIEIKDSFPSFVELHMGSYAYTGGAHGNGYYSITMIDKENGAVLNVEDFISDVDELNKIALPYFLEERMIKDGDLSDFWFDETGFSVNNNFYFEEASLIFEYNSYEIAPYSTGPTTLKIPVSEIEHLLIREID